jgi:kynureninase
MKHEPESLAELRRAAHQLDRDDPLHAMRARFGPAIDAVLYLDGNSLGALPQATAPLIQHTVEHEWGSQLIRSWNHGWFDLPRRLGTRLAPLLGAQTDEVLFCDSVTINAFKLIAGALTLRAGRHTVVTDAFNFPSNFHVLHGVFRLMGIDGRCAVAQSADGVTLPAAAFDAHLGPDVALLMVSHVAFKSGYLHDLKALCDRAHAVGALVLADLSHSVGAVPIDLNAWGVDLAVGCSYKFMNGGPGAPAFLYVRRSLIDNFPIALPGWFGSRQPFLFETQHHAAPGIERLQVGTPPILSLRAIEPGIALLEEAGIANLRRKSGQLSTLLVDLWRAALIDRGFELGSPLDAQQRGSHVALRHPEAGRITQALIHPAAGQQPVIPDFRTPDNLRLGISPLYLRHSDLVAAVTRICEIVDTAEYQQHKVNHDAVT